MANESDELRKLRATVESLAQRVARLEQGATLQPVAAQTDPSKKLEARLGLTVVNRIGAVTLAIGILFLLKYAADAGWITPPARVGLGILGGLSLIGIAEWLRHHHQRVFSQGLCGCGLAAIYATVYAAFSYYQFVSLAISFAGLVLTCGLAVALSFRYESAAIASLGFAGAFLAPLLLFAKPGSPWGNFAYLTAVATAAGVVAHRKVWLLLLLSSAPEALLAAYIRLHAQKLGFFAAFAVCLALGYFAVSFRTSGRAAFRESAYVLAHICLLFGLLRVLELWSEAMLAAADQSNFLSAAISILLAGYAVMLIVWGVFRSSGVNRALGLALIALVIAKLYLYDVWRLTEFYRVTAFFALGVLLLGASYIYSRVSARPRTKRF